MDMKIGLFVSGPQPISWLIPTEAAADAEAPLTECALNVVVSIPADCNVGKIHLAMEDEVQGYVAGHKTKELYFSIIACSSKGFCPIHVGYKDFFWTQSNLGRPSV